MYLVDTNVISEARRGAPAAVDWLRSVDPEGLFLSVVTLGEIMRGVARKQKSDPVAGARLDGEAVGKGGEELEADPHPTADAVAT